MPIARLSPFILSPFRRSSVARTMALVLVAMLASGCADITGPGALDREQRDLSRAWRTWSSNFIDDYEYVVRRDCFCQFGGVEVRVTVRNRSVIAREIDGTSTPVPGSAAYNYPSIDGLFSIIQEAIDHRAYRIDSRYDSGYGFPTDIWIDHERRAVDDEERFTLLAFRSLR